MFNAMAPALMFQGKKPIQREAPQQPQALPKATFQQREDYSQTLNGAFKARNIQAAPIALPFSERLILIFASPASREAACAILAKNPVNGLKPHPTQANTYLYETDGSVQPVEVDFQVKDPRRC